MLMYTLYLNKYTKQNYIYKCSYTCMLTHKRLVRMINEIDYSNYFWVNKERFLLYQ